MHPLLKSISELKQVPIPPFEMNGTASDWYWFDNNGILTESDNAIVVNADNANGAIVYHVYDGNLSKDSHVRLSEIFDRHPHLVVVNEDMFNRCGMKDNNWLQYCLTSVKVNEILQRGYK